MNNFAHNGVVHTTNTEAIAHITTDIARLLILALAIILVILATYSLYKKLSFVRVEIKNRKGSR